jgi:hypothetical protein
MGVSGSSFTQRTERACFGFGIEDELNSAGNAGSAQVVQQKRDQRNKCVVAIAHEGKRTMVYVMTGRLRQRKDRSTAKRREDRYTEE